MLLSHPASPNRAHSTNLNLNALLSSRMPVSHRIPHIKLPPSNPSNPHLHITNKVFTHIPLPSTPTSTLSTPTSPQTASTHIHPHLNPTFNHPPAVQHVPTSPMSP